jgi:hypothetical protein
LADVIAAIGIAQRPSNAKGTVPYMNAHTQVTHTSPINTYHCHLLSTGMHLSPAHVLF